jgi:leader peptidase (prepilin peptidase)/N-methyltransferase
LLTAVLFVGSYYLFWFTVEALLFALLFVFLILITFYDLKHMIVPDEFSIPWNVLAFLSIFVSGNTFSFDVSNALNHIGAGVALFCFFTFLWWITRGKGMGFADGIIALGIGFILGFPLSITALLLSFWIGAGIFLALMAYQKVGTKYLVGERARLTMKSEVPFGPYLALGFLIALFTNVSFFI